MAISDTFRTIEAVSEGLFKEKGSRFVAGAYPVTDEQQIKSIIEQVRKAHHEAKHHCYAYIIGNDGLVWRANDDGEPSGTAGRPILGKIKSFGLTNIMVIVSRYFGGTLLGVSGLINAYKTAADSALSNAVIVDRLVLLTYELMFPYSVMNDVMKIIKDENMIQAEQKFDLNCRIVVRFRESALGKIKNRFMRIENLEMKILAG